MLSEVPSSVPTVTPHPGSSEDVEASVGYIATCYGTCAHEHIRVGITTRNHAAALPQPRRGGLPFGCLLESRTAPLRHHHVYNGIVYTTVVCTSSSCRRFNRSNQQSCPILCSASSGRIRTYAVYCSSTDVNHPKPLPTLISSTSSLKKREQLFL